MSGLRGGESFRFRVLTYHLVQRRGRVGRRRLRGRERAASLARELLHDPLQVAVALVLLAAQRLRPRALRLLLRAPEGLHALSESFL